MNWSASKYDFSQGEGGVSQFLIFSDKWWRGGKPISDFWLTRGEGGLDPPILADTTCEQPHTFKRN